MSRIIVGYDGSPAAAAALVWAAEQARLTTKEVQVITVDDSPGEFEVGDSVIFNRLHPEVAHLTVDVASTHSIEHGGVAETLIGACTAGDLLVVGSRGRAQLSERVLGSVSHACLHAAPCSMVVVRERSPEDLGVVLVAVDGSEGSRRALKVADEQSRLRGLRLKVIHAVHWDYIGVEGIAPTEDELIAWGRQLVEKELAEVGVDADVHIKLGPPAEVLAEASAQADLMVMGARGRNPLAALVLGSIADHCVRHAHCPVMLVRSR